MSVPECIKQIVSQKTYIVGFTVYNSNYGTALLIAAGIKEAAPQTVIVFGGPTPTVRARTILERNHFVDICVRNEGEETFFEFVTLLEGESFEIKKAAGALEGIRGISFRLGDRVVETPPRNTFSMSRDIPDYLDKYPSPYLSGIIDDPSMGLLTARGCNQNCVYCNCSAMTRRTIVTHSVDRVIEEVAYISKNLEIESPLEIFDDAFTLIPGRAMEICRRLIENKNHVPLACATRCDMLTEDMIKMMREAGFVSLNFSLESGVPRVLRAIGKVQPPYTTTDPNYEKEKFFIEKFKTMAAAAKRAGIEVVSSSIIIGLPSETGADARQTIHLIDSLIREGTLDCYSHNTLKIFPGTPIFETYEKSGLKLVDYGDGIYFKTIHAFDTFQIPVAPHSVGEKSGKANDEVNRSFLALSPLEQENENCIRVVILMDDQVRQELIAWLQKYMAVNGDLIQVYSTMEKALEYHADNERRLITGLSPTAHHSEYYICESDIGLFRLKPFRFHTVGQGCGTEIDFIRTGEVFDCNGGINRDFFFQSIAIDKEREDILSLHRFLESLCDREDALGFLMDAPLYPYFSSLCRWEKNTPNCRSLNTAWIDSSGHTRTCRHGEPVGKVGMSLPDIKQNMKLMVEIMESCRGCPVCQVREQCARCLFPGPIPEPEFCSLRKNTKSHEASALLRTFDALKV